MTTYQFFTTAWTWNAAGTMHSRRRPVSVASSFGQADMFSAKGATFIPKPGAAPQDYGNVKPPALKVRFTFGTSSMHEYLKSLRRHGADFDERYVWLNRAFSACPCCNRSPGASPQAKADIAPLALNSPNSKLSNRTFR
jgi:hypothetical protein